MSWWLYIIVVVSVAWGLAVIVQFYKGSRKQPPTFIDEARDATFATLLASLEEHPEQWKFGDLYIKDGKRVLQSNDKRDYLFNRTTGICIRVRKLLHLNSTVREIGLTGTRTFIPVPAQWQPKLDARIRAMATALDEEHEVVKLKSVVERFKNGVAK